MPRCSTRVTVVLVSLLLAPTWTSAREIGSATVDITPSYPVRLSGYASRREETAKIEQRIYASAIAIHESPTASFVLLAVDSIGVPAGVTEEVARRLEAKANLPRKRFALTSTHSHSTPCLNGFAPALFPGPLPPAHQAHIDRYTGELTDALEKVSLEALRDRKKVTSSFAQGKATFAANRRTRGGPVDHSLPVLRFNDETGKTRAILLTYACHCTTLTGSFNLICGDWAGYAREYIARAHPGATVLVTIGCGADSNPNPRPGIELAKKYGRQLSDEVARLFKGEWRSIGGNLRGNFKRIDLPFDKLPTRADWEKRAASGGAVGYHAQLQLARLDRGEKIRTKLSYPVQSWAFGEDLVMVFLAGEVVVDYALRLKKEFDSKRFWIHAYSNDVPCYIPSRRILREGGYEGGGAMIYFDQPTRFHSDVEELIIDAVWKTVPEGYRTADARRQFPPPLDPHDALRTFSVPEDLQVELVAAEPLVIDPVAVDFGLDGRVWVVEMHDYPTGLDGNWKPGGRVRVLRDTTGDGRLDRGTVFIDDLPFPTGLMLWRDGVLICAAPDILFARDTDGDDRADVRQPLLTGFATSNYQARVNGLSYGLDNWVYGANGLIGGTVRSLKTGKSVDIGKQDFRFNPDTGAFETASGLTQQGRVRDDWGNWFGNENWALLRHYPLPDHYVRRNPHVPTPNPRHDLPTGAHPNRLFPTSVTLERFNDPHMANRTTSACGTGIYRDQLLGPDYYGNAFICEPVHNLVHRLTLAPNGVTFTAARPPSEQSREFLASKDNWFRPVQAATGPDGALWIVDMYRFVIEHPRWISKGRLSRLEVRAGAERGRLYRVFPRRGRPRRVEDVATLSTTQLAARLDQTCGPRRDAIHRELVHRQDEAAVPTLKRLAKSANVAAVRVHALCTLAGLRAVTPQLPQLLATALSDSDPAVRRHALRLSEPFLRSNPELRSQVFERAKDAHATVRYQLALSLGQSRDFRSAEVLGQLAVRDLADPWHRAAVLSSATAHPGVVLRELLRQRASHPKAPAFIGHLVRTAAASSDERVLRETLLAVLPEESGESSAPLATWQLEALGSLLEAAPSEALTAALCDRLRLATAFARGCLVDRRAPVERRISSARLLGRDAERRAEDLEALLKCLDDREAPRLHNAVLDAIGRRNDPEVAHQLLDLWLRSDAQLRSRLTTTLLSRESWTFAFLKALAKKRLSRTDLDAQHRERLLQHENPEVQRQAAELFAEASTQPRPEALAQYAAVLETSGEKKRGALWFAKRCESCHAFQGRGNAVGPDLAALTDRSSEYLLTAIVHPNATLEPKYSGHIVVTVDGRAYSGLLTAETGTTVTLLQTNNLRTEILRKNIARLQNTGRSFMPEGLQKGMSVSDVADLVAYLQGGK